MSESPKLDTTRIAVIMAGGSGERFWPLSRRRRPKQLLPLVNENRTLLEDSIDWVAPLFDPANLYLSITEPLEEPIRNAALPLSEENILVEPNKRNTMGCLAFFTAHILARPQTDPTNLSVAVITADQWIGDVERFRNTLSRALQIVEEREVFATIGIPPTRPETGFGYIELPHMWESLVPAPAKGVPGPTKNTAGPGVELLDQKHNQPFHQILRFREKPNQETAQDFIDSGRFLWNSGMSFWRVSTFLNELRIIRPSLAEAIEQMKEAILAKDEASVRQIFEGLDSISIDCALFEKSNRVLVTCADFPWDDIGTWAALSRVRETDETGNLKEGDPILIDSNNCVVINEPGAENRTLALVGVNDLAVVVSEDAVLVIPKERSQDVRKIVAELKRQDSNRL